MHAAASAAARAARQTAAPALATKLPFMATRAFSQQAGNPLAQFEQMAKDGLGKVRKRQCWFEQMTRDGQTSNVKDHRFLSSCLNVKIYSYLYFLFLPTRSHPRLEILLNKPPSK